jgi:hypothetical protein
MVAWLFTDKTMAPVARRTNATRMEPLQRVARTTVETTYEPLQPTSIVLPFDGCFVLRGREVLIVFHTGAVSIQVEDVISGEI